MRQAKLCVVLLTLALSWHGLPEQGFAWDHTQSTNFGVRVPGDTVRFTVKPPKNAQGKDAIVTKGNCDDPGGYSWKGGLATWWSTIRPDYPSSHSGRFSGEYGYPGTGGPSRALTWKMDTLAEVVKLETITDATIPSNRTRRKLGVGEKVTLTLKGADNSVVWSRIGLGSIYPMSGSSTKFTAYEKGNGAVVIATYKGKQYTAGFQVFEPASISAVKLREYYYVPGEQGAGMTIELTIHPSDVSFNEVKYREIAGPATSDWGYFTNSSPEDLYHHPKDWQEINVDNMIGDSAQSRYRLPPWYPGGYQWVIPNQWQSPAGSYIGALPTVVQTFTISDTNGTTTVSKQFGNSVSVTRTP